MRVRQVIAGCATALALYLTASGAANSPVADAAMKGDKAALRSLLEQKADVNAPQADGATAIQWAAYKNDLDMADLLIGAGANVKTPNREGATPLYLASINGSAAMIEKLLKAGADPNERGPQGETPLMLASRNGNTEAIQVLLDHKADVNAKEKLRGTTALMWASEQAHPAAVKLLIEHGADVRAASNPDTRNARNNLADTVTKRLNSSLGALGQARARGNGKGAAGSTRASGRKCRGFLCSLKNNGWRRPNSSGVRGPRRLPGLRQDSGRGGSGRQPADPLWMDPAVDCDTEPALQAGGLPVGPRRESEHRQQRRLDAPLSGDR